MERPDYSDTSRWWPVVMAANAVPVKCSVGTIHNWAKAGHFEIQMKDLRSAVVNAQEFERYLMSRWSQYKPQTIVFLEQSTA